MCLGLTLRMAASCFLVESSGRSSPAKGPLWLVNTSRCVAVTGDALLFWAIALNSSESAKNSGKRPAEIGGVFLRIGGVKGTSSVVEGASRFAEVIQ